MRANVKRTVLSVVESGIKVALCLTLIPFVYVLGYAWYFASGDWKGDRKGWRASHSQPKKESKV